MTALPKPREFGLPDAWRIPVELGFSVIPVQAGDKRPALASWKAYQTAAADEATVRAWASRPGNVGIVTGAVSKLIVLDLDHAEAIAEAERRGLPATISVRTGKGLHVYFAHPGGALANGAGIFPGADFRGDGGYVVAPGSIHPSGATYAWENPPGLFDLAPPPAWLLALLRKPAIAAEAEKVRRAPQGTRNDQLNKSAFKLAQDGIGDTADARSALADAALAAGLDPHEVRRTLDSGADAGRTAPKHNKRDAPSEDDIALAFTDRHRGKLLFDHDVGAWFEWDGARWRQDNKHRAFSYARQLGREGGAAGKATFAGGVERFARADEAHAVDASVWDADAMLLGTPGGTVDLRTGDCFDARPADYITKLAACAPVNGAPELWLRFLNEALDGDQEAIRFLKLWVGYCLTGDTREHALIFLHGLAGTGKTVFLNTVATIMGDYAVTAAMDTFTASKFDRHPTELAMLRGARLVTASETEEGRAWAEARIKQMTGGDPITAHFMRQDNFTFRPHFKLTIVGNHAPRLTNPDDAMRRRFNILGFNVKPAAPDLLLETKLKAEHGRILQWAIDGCLEWQREGLVRPAAVTSATTEYFAGEDLMGQWISENCDARPGAIELPAKLYNDWRKYAEEHGEAPGTAIGFGKKMSKRGYQAKPSCGVRMHHGLELRPTMGGYHAD